MSISAAAVSFLEEMKKESMEKIMSSQLFVFCWQRNCLIHPFFIERQSERKSVGEKERERDRKREIN